MLRKAGSLKSLTLMEETELGDDRVRTYEVEFENRLLRLRIAIAPDGTHLE